MKKALIILALIFITLSPSASFAQTPVQTAPPLDYSGFVKCDGVVQGRKSDGTPIPGESPKPGEEGRQTVCNFAALMNTINQGIQWMFYISIPVATVLFAYGGLLYMSGEKGKIDQAKKIFVSVGTGFIIMVVAFFAVRTFVSWLVDDPTATQFLEK